MTCHVAVLTPTGKGAVATIAVTGPGAAALVSQFVERASGKSLLEARPSDVVVGTFTATGQTTGEELVIAVESAEQVLLHPHGGLAAIEAMVSSLEKAECVRQSWRDYLRQHASDPWDAEIQILLTQARTLPSARLLMGQQAGTMRKALADLAQKGIASDKQNAISQANRMLQLAPLGLAIARGGFRLVVAGRPNVGKSRLINRWLGYERSIVFDQPGTTRDVVETPMALGGWPFLLLDTAGLRETIDPIEREGVLRARQAISKADLVLLLFDASSGWTQEDAELEQRLQTLLRESHAGMTRAKLVRVQNKSDLVTDNSPSDSTAIAISAETGSGMADLEVAILRELVPQPLPQKGEAVPVLEQQVQEITAIQTQWESQR